MLGELGFNSKGKRYGQCIDNFAVNQQGASLPTKNTKENKVENDRRSGYSNHKVALSGNKDVLLIEDACEILHLARPTVYAMCQKGLIPYS